MQSVLTNIVVGVGDPDSPEPHLRGAIALAARENATLHVVHAFNPPDIAPYPYPNVGVLTPELLRQQYAAVLERLEKSVRQMTTSDSVRCRAEPMPSAGAILEVSDEVGADLVIVGATRRGRVARAVLGTTAQRVARGAHAPVLVVRGEGDLHVRKVLMTTDLTELSVRVHELGRALIRHIAPDSEPTVRTLHAIGFEIPLAMPIGTSELERFGRDQLDTFLERVPLGSMEEREVRRGDPSDVITAEADEWGADLIVLGTHGRTGPGRFLIGSVAESVLRRAHCNVLVIPASAVETDAERAERRAREA